jgi:hypothetical protein
LRTDRKTGWSRKYNPLVGRRFVVVDYAGMDAIVAREAGKRRVQRIPVNEAVTLLRKKR